MADVVEAAVRSRMMAGIRGTNTKPEIAIRHGLHRLGFRYRIHSAALSGKPDVVLRRYRAVVLVHGCFWHGHDCHLFRWPGTRRDFWRAKIIGNRARDAEVLRALMAASWRVLIVWECAVKGKHRRPIDAVIAEIAAWLKRRERGHEIRGNNLANS
jgi:DNA mismatch endonuclease, patch repair protein